MYTERLLAEQYGEGVVRLPSGATFNRLVHALADGRGLLVSAYVLSWLWLIFVGGDHPGAGIGRTASRARSDCALLNFLCCYRT